MVGLRERKKEQTRHSIVAAAAACFAEQGLDTTTMEEVAASAEVSVGTLYNYFGSKSALLLAVVAQDADLMVTRAAAVVAEPGPDPVAATSRILDLYLDLMFELGREFLREVLRASFDTRFRDLMPELIRLDEHALEQVAALLSHFGEEGLVTTDVDRRDAALLLFSIVATNLLLFATVQDMTEAEIRTQVHRQVDAAFHGLNADHQPNPSKTG